MPKTIRQYAIDWLVQNMLFEEDAIKIVEEAEKSPANEAMIQGGRSRWDDDIEGYPPMITNLTIMSVRREALKWIDANCPQHFARSLFADA